MRAFSHALAAITAAVVGVILNLAIWFGLHVLFKRMESVSLGPLSWDVPVLSSLDPWMALLSAAALIAVFRFHLGLSWLLGGAALAGMALRLFLFRCNAIPAARYRPAKIRLPFATLAIAFRSMGTTRSPHQIPSATPVSKRRY